MILILYNDGLTKRWAEQCLKRQSSQTGNAPLQVYFEKDDDAIIHRLTVEAHEHHSGKPQEKRQTCFLVLKSMTTLWMLQTTGIPKEVLDKFDVFATTLVDFMAKSLLVKLPNMSYTYPALDYKPITIDSNNTVHLVIIGATDLAEAIAINAALVAHYPNYSREHRLRTRITILSDNIFEWRDQLIQKYQHLFDNSYYRTIDLEEDLPHCTNHSPMYSQTREDFVDIEWEFVNGNTTNDAFRTKMSEWSLSEAQLLTIALCHNDTEANRDQAILLPEEIYLQQTPVLCYAESTELLNIARTEDKYKCIHPFGSNICHIDILRNLLELAKEVNYVYNYSFSSATESVSIPTSINISQLDELWSQVSTLPKQYSNIFNAMTLGTKMHSLGHGQDDWEAYYAVSRDEVEILTEVEHNRWNVEELILGYRPTTDEEQKVIENDISQKKSYRSKKIHYDLRAFNDLRVDATGKNVYIYDMALSQSIPLIMKICTTK